MIIMIIIIILIIIIIMIMMMMMMMMIIIVKSIRPSSEKANTPFWPFILYLESIFKVLQNWHLIYTEHLCFVYLIISTKFR